MGACRRDDEAVPGGELHHVTAQPHQLPPDLRRRAAHAGADLHHRLGRTQGVVTGIDVRVRSAHLAEGTA